LEVDYAFVRFKSVMKKKEEKVARILEGGKIIYSGSGSREYMPEAS
jgi:hypothetical protein